ncbi:MAG: hypothetical protein HDQ97_03720 [Lachnospiraceae bacterium]|nr:hypothetical protein [Lachnospiraceae bacterium]
MEENNRRIAIIQYFQDYMEECFQHSCRLFQTNLEKHGNRIWDDLKDAINKILQVASQAQKQGQKGDIQYLAFSFLRSSLYVDRMELRIEVLDDGFYLDRQETAGDYCITFLRERFLGDLSLLYRKVKEKFIRFQNYELSVIKMQYSSYYDALAYRMIENLRELIVQEVLKSGISITDNFKIIYGEFMDKAVVVYEKGEGQ